MVPPCPHVSKASITAGASSVAFVPLAGTVHSKAREGRMRNNKVAIKTNIFGVKEGKLAILLNEPVFRTAAQGRASPTY